MYLKTQLRNLVQTKGTVCTKLGIEMPQLSISLFVVFQLLFSILKHAKHHKAGLYLPVYHLPRQQELEESHLVLEIFKRMHQRSAQGGQR